MLNKKLDGNLATNIYGISASLKIFSGVGYFIYFFDIFYCKNSCYHKNDEKGKKNSKNLKKGIVTG